MSRRMLLEDNYSENGLMPVTDGLICWLDGRDYVTGENIWRDRSGNNKDATLNDNSGIKQNNSLYFKGYGNIENPTLGLEEYTIEVHLKDLKNGYWNGLFGNTSSTTKGASLFLNKSVQLGVYPPGKLISNILTIKDNMVITTFCESNKWTTYINGVFYGSYDKTINPSLADYLVICARKPNSYNTSTDTGTDYRLNEWYSFKIYNRALTEEEIQQNYLYEQSIERGE